MCLHTESSFGLITPGGCFQCRGTEFNGFIDSVIGGNFKGAVECSGRGPHRPCLPPLRTGFEDRSEEALANFAMVLFRLRPTHWPLLSCCLCLYVFPAQVSLNTPSFLPPPNSYSGVLQPSDERVDLRGQNERAPLRACWDGVWRLHVHFW